MDGEYDEEGCLVVVAGLGGVLGHDLCEETGGTTTAGSAGALPMCHILLPLLLLLLFLLVFVVLLFESGVVFLVRIAVMVPVMIGEGGVFVVVVGMGVLYPKEHWEFCQSPGLLLLLLLLLLS
jgi:hypothetical protein